MNTEELKIKVSLDTTGLKGDMARVKSTMSDVKKDINVRGSASGTDDLNKSFEQLHDTLDSIRNLNFAQVLAGISAITARMMNYDFGDEKGFGKLKALMESLKIDTKDVTSEMSGLQGKLEGLAPAITKIFGSTSAGAIAAGVAALAVIVAELAAVVAAFAIALKHYKEVAAMSREATKIGLSAHEYEEWGYILRQNGIEIDKLSDFLKTLAAEQNAVREGSEDTIKAFERLGISAQEAASMSQSELFERTVLGLQNITNEVERTGLAYKIFGEDDAANLIPILSMNNQQLEQLRRNYELLGGAASETLVQRSQQLQNSMSNLNMAWQGIKNTITEAVLPVIISFVNWLTVAIAKIGMFFRAVFGIDAKAADNSNNSMSSGMNSYTTAVEGATAAVQKLKREQMGFDELNVLPGKDSSGGGGGGSTTTTTTGGGGMGDLNIPTFDSSGLEQFAEKMEKYKSLIQMLVPILLVGAGAIMAVLGFGLGNIPLGIAGLGLAGIGIAVGVSNGGWEQIAKTLKAGIDDIKMSIIVWFKNMEVRIKDWWNGVKQSCSEGLTKAKDTMSKGFEPIKKWYEKNIKPVFTKKFWQDKWGTLSAGAKEKLDAAKKSCTDTWNSITKWFSKNVGSKFTKKYWQGKFDGLRAGMADKISAAKKACTDAWSSITKWYKKSVAPKFTKKYWQGKFETIKSGAKAAFNGVIAVVEKAINNIIKKINTLSWKIPNWVPGVGGEKFGFNFKNVSIPRLATGGIATRSVLANIGEAGAEAVLPLENNTSWMDKLADKIASRGAGGKLILQVDGRTLGWVAIDNINQITRQTGEIPLTI